MFPAIGHRRTRRSFERPSRRNRAQRPELELERRERRTHEYGPSVPSKRPRDALLVPDQFPSLNSAFYATRPWEYFRRREHALIVAAGARGKLLEAAQEGIRVGRLEYTLSGEDETEEQDDDWDRFVLAESQVLLHHASETLLRLYLAHEGLPPCPWLEVARVRSPQRFKDDVKRRFLGDLSDKARRRRVTEVFFGTRDRKALEPTPPEEEWIEGADNLERFLCRFASDFLDADLYNALKHGLAVMPGEAMVKVGDGDLLKAEGPSIEYLSVRPDSLGRERWNRSTRWLKVDTAITFACLARSVPPPVHRTLLW